MSDQETYVQILTKPADPQVVAKLRRLQSGIIASAVITFIIGRPLVVLCLSGLAVVIKHHSYEWMFALGLVSLLTIILWFLSMLTFLMFIVQLCLEMRKHRLSRRRP